MPDIFSVYRSLKVELPTRPLTHLYLECFQDRVNEKSYETTPLKLCLTFFNGVHLREDQYMSKTISKSHICIFNP